MEPGLYRAFNESMTRLNQAIDASNSPTAALELARANSAVLLALAQLAMVGAHPNVRAWFRNHVETRLNGATGLARPLVEEALAMIQSGVDRDKGRPAQ